MASVPLRPYDEVADLIGSVPGLPSDLSTTSGKRIAEIVRERRRDGGVTGRPEAGAPATPQN